MMQKSVCRPAARTHYPVEFRERLVVLARVSHSIERLARQYDPFAATIHDWIRQGVADEGARDDRLTGTELDELHLRRREVNQLRQGSRPAVKARGLICTRRRVIAEVINFMTAKQAEYSIQLM
ncbi:hypothetical protein [Paracoccus albus]|uniref:hypothetical protein n=1 Tax=Paracoccus albus TaxID=3017784 RepID=UPI0022F04FE7|nr:hypothetical protein [Paracoccus albus]WBU60892.1 hypothetical protein PAF20_02935 [Paracoccus albus]